MVILDGSVNGLQGEIILFRRKFCTRKVLQAPIDPEALQIRRLAWSAQRRSVGAIIASESQLRVRRVVRWQQRSGAAEQKFGKADDD
jgi:hypothetical protein